MKPNTQKRSFDCPDELYAKVMEFAIRNKIYKFGPALIAAVEKALASETQEQK